MGNAKENMIDAFFELAQKKPVNTIKVKQVTDLANCNRCTFYQYFNDIYDLLDQAENQIIQQIKIEVEKSYFSAASYEEILVIMASACQKFGKILNLLMGPNGSPSFRNKYMNTLRPMISSIMKNKNLEYNDFIAEYALGAFISTVNYWCYHHDNMSARELASLIYKLTTKGVFPD